MMKSGAEGLRDERNGALLRLAAHVHLTTGEIFARLPLALGRETPALLDVLVHPVDEVGHPADARLEARDAEPRMPLEDAAQHERRRRDHHVEREAHDVDLEVVVEALRAEHGKMDAGCAVDAERHVELLAAGVEIPQIRVVEVPALQDRGDHRRDEPEPLRLAHDPDRRGDVLDRHERDAEHAGGELPAVAGEPAVVEARELGGECRVGEARKPESGAREEDHRVDALAVGVVHDAGGGEGIGAAVEAHAVLRVTAGAGARRVRVAPALDDERRTLLVGAGHADLLGKRARSSLMSSVPSITWASLSTTFMPPFILQSGPARQPERLLGDERAEHLGRAGRDRDGARVQIRFFPRAAVERTPVAAELRPRAGERHRDVEGPLLDLAAEELLQGRLRRCVGGAVETRQDAERVRREHLGLDPRLRDTVAERRAVGPPAGAHAAIQVDERARPVLQPDLEVERPERPALVRERARMSGQPPFTAPITFPAGTRTSSRKSSLNSARPLIWTSGRHVTPALRMSTTRQVMPLCFGTSGSVRTRRSAQSAKWALLDQTF
jgi:hypothetical protein